MFLHKGSQILWWSVLKIKAVTESMDIMLEMNEKIHNSIFRIKISVMNMIFSPEIEKVYQGTTSDFFYVCIGFGKNQQQNSNHDVSVVYLIAMQKLVCTSVAIQLN